MQCFWDDTLLQNSGRLPDELLQIIKNGNDEQYLQAFTAAAHDPRYTYLLLTHCEDILAQVCYNLRDYGSLSSAVAALGRIIPYAPFLAPCAIRLLDRERYVITTSTEESELTEYLLGIYRLLRSDHRTFGKYVPTVALRNALGRVARPATYLIIRILQIRLHASDLWLEDMVKKHLGDDTMDGSIDGSWDNRIIDYRFLTLWETTRSANVERALKDARNQPRQTRRQSLRTIDLHLLDDSVTLMGNVLFPRAESRSHHSGSHNDHLVRTQTMEKNIDGLARALKLQKSLLLTGLPGCGKSTLIQHAASALGQLDSMVTLHLNEQSDAKTLLGLHTTGDVPGTFVWKPGVLTTAVLEGRWVLIEDLDRAPNEIIGILLPLIERRELTIPSRKETIHATSGFRLLATIRSSLNQHDNPVHSGAHILGARHWQIVNIDLPTVEEHQAIAQNLYPNLTALLPQFIALFWRIKNVFHSPGGKQSKGRTREVDTRDFLKWCRRVNSLLGEGRTFTSHDIDSIFLEAMDCFAGAIADHGARDAIAEVAAEELHIDPQRRDFLLNGREASYTSEKTRVNIGRYSLPVSRRSKAAETNFSTSPHTTRMLECVTGAVLNREPLLLVGETGVGKTTAVQHLANSLGKRLVAFNLSQQSEAGDILGGFKPVNTRSLMMPLKDTFDELFAESFRAAKNQQFLEMLAKQSKRSNWRSVCKLWRQALKMVEQQRSVSPSRSDEAPNKKRKIEGKTALDFPRWDEFARQLDAVESTLSTSGETFAFRFVEGNIVKAVRNGDWILLDEINLASADTLESIVDLFDHIQPSLLLTESGNVDRLVAHAEFRVFAAMNPATDVGKKDLPPGVRSRFTEIYVDGPDKDLKSLQSIVRSYLKQECMSDTALALEVSQLYQKINALAHDNRLVDGAGQRPHFSLRTLTRVLQYAKRMQQFCTLRRALYEGFQMSFLTFLDAESATLVQPLIEEYLFSKRTNVRAELRKSLRRPDDEYEYIQAFPSSKHWIRKGPYPAEEQPHYIFTPFVERNLENLARAASTRQSSILIQGPTSSGKTSMIEYLAKRSGHKFVRINNHEHTDLQEYLGTYVSGPDGRLHFQDGLLVQALREGHWIVLDELNLAPTDVLEALNRLLDDNRELLMPETQEIVRPHSEFMLFATQNPAGLYGGRKPLSRAFRNRFLELHFDDIPIEELQDILHRRTLLPRSRCEKIVAVYTELATMRQENRLFEQKSFATLRDLFRWALRDNDTIEKLAANGFMLLCERVRKDEERLALKNIIERIMSKKGPKVSIDEDALYSSNSPEVTVYQSNASEQGVVWTRAMRRLYVLVNRALQNKEPVLLVGETGCGKTTVCQMLADALKKQLHIVNAHQNTETADLIGSQRPVRNRANIESMLRNQLLSSELLRDHDRVETASTEDLTAMYDEQIAALGPETKSAILAAAEHLRIQDLRSRLKALFEWVDGSLVHSMKQGHFFLLDEISLADDSVLERINSVLESQRTIMLAEKGSLDSLVTAKDEFQFFATMNPGGDYGKRELSPALRNRFTEIWVPPLSDLADVLQIVQAKLCQPAQQYANSIVQFAHWFRGRYNTSASVSVSIRDTLAWINIINLSAKSNVQVAFVQGAAMVYIDTLGANPAGLMSLSLTSLQQERDACLAKLAQVGDVDAAAIYYQPIVVDFTERQFSIGPYIIPRHSRVIDDDPTFSFDPQTTRSNALRVLRALQLQKPVMLEGSPGVGKTALVTAIAAAAKMPLARINLSDQTDLLDLFGSDTPVEGAEAGNFAWRDAPFLHAMKQGHWVLLDEMNLASQAVLEGLNACLDHRGEVFIPELGQTFSRHPDFRIFAAQNPHHQGGGRKGLPASFVNRFTVVYADTFSSSDLMLISQRKFPSVDKEYIKAAIDFVDQLSTEVSDRRSFGASGGPWEFNLRDMTRWLTLAGSSSGLIKTASPRDLVDFLFSLRFRTAHDRQRLQEVFQTHFPTSRGPSGMYCNTSTQTIQVGLGLLERNTLDSESSPLRHPRFTPEQLQTLQGMMMCVQNNWPVILAGPPGVGKNYLIEKLAMNVGATVRTIALNSETDSLDLIGGYEQHDPARLSSELSTILRGEFRRLCKLALAYDTPANVDSLLASLETIDFSVLEGSDFALIAQQLPVEVRPEALQVLKNMGAARSMDKAKFEWIDGPLIDAMRDGNWLILDNANLCSSSVLDRLNSLLEPSGVLSVNEHTNTDGTTRLIRPHAEFRIFLTVNPRQGELSRAMRNRAVELYLSPAQEGCQLTCDPLAAESAMTRFQAVGHSLASMEILSEHQLAVARDHLGLRDHILLRRFEQQLRNGMFAIYEDFNTSAVSLMTPAMHDFEGERTILKLYYEDLKGDMLPLVDFVDAQTLHPLNNEHLVRRKGPLDAAVLLASRHELLFSFSSVLRAFDLVEDDRKMRARIAQVSQAVHRGQGTTDFLKMLRSIVNTLDSWQLRSNGTQPLEVVRLAVKLLSFISVVLGKLKTSKIDAGTLNACSFVGKRLCLDGLDAQQTTDPGQIVELVRKFNGFNRTFTDDIAQACVFVWKALKPPAPKTTLKLEAVRRFENTVNEFDRIAHESKLSMPETIALRTAIQDSLELIDTNADFDALATEIDGVLPKRQAASEEPDAGTSPPHFAQSFELLCQIFTIMSLEQRQLDTTVMSTIETLACRATINSVNFRDQMDVLAPWKKLRLLGLLSHSSALEYHPEIDFQDHSYAYTSIINQISSVQSVPLSRLELLKFESTTLGRIVSTKMHIMQETSHRELRHCLRELTKEVLHALEDSTATDNSACSAKALLQLMSNGDGALNDARDVSTDSTSRIGGALGLLFWLVRYLIDDKDGVVVRDSAAAWQAFALACLRLYIPGSPLDPLQVYQIQLGVHEHQQSDAQARLNSLQCFRKAWMGSEECLRAQFLELELEILGEGPPRFEICRPQQSLLSDLWQDLGVLMRLLEPLYHQPLLKTESQITMLNESGWTNLKVIRGRLKEQYRPYADFVAPIIGFIDCLLIARRLSTHASFAVELDHIAKITPFAGAKLCDWISDDSFAGAFAFCETRGERLHWLTLLGSRRTVSQREVIRPLLRAQIDAAFDTFYKQWRDELNREQALTAAKSSLYKYRGGDQMDDEGSPEEIDGMFPSFENEIEGSTSDERSASEKAQELSTKVAALYHSIFSMAQGEPELLANLDSGSSVLTSSGGQQMRSYSLAPMMLCTLNHLSSNLNGNDNGATRINFYTDANLAQCEKLLALLVNIRQRFDEIHQVWPEHATPIEVIRGCQSIQAFSHGEPLAKFIPSVEKLHATIYEWQKISSSEFSAANLFDGLTDLIVSWRQAELSSWAGLFNDEDARCKRDSSSWWYVMYETIIKPTEDSAEGSESWTRFHHDLIDTMGSFLQSCGLGEFSHRLNMLRDSLADLSLHSDVTHPRRKHIRNAVASLIAYYSHFEGIIDAQLATKRNVLEAKVKEVIQLASWKDRNIEKLRISAKSSHKKLFRLVRKYRHVLAEAVAPYIQGDFPESSVSNTKVRPRVIEWRKLDSMGNNSMIKSMSSIGGQSAERFLDLAATSNANISNTRTEELESPNARVIQSWLDELMEDIKGLRKATPGVMNDDNKSLVQHLKAQKRRLLADVLKAARVMGFQTNLSEGVLAQQQSTHLILSRTSPIESVQVDEEHFGREFYKMLHIVPAMRHSTVKHSEDLTPAEVARAKVLIESMLQTSIEQHNTLSSSSMAALSILSASNRLRALVTSQAPSRRSAGGIGWLTTDAIMRNITAALKASMQCILYQSQLSNSDYSSLLAKLNEVMQELQAIIQELDRWVDMPDTIACEETRGFEMRWSASMETLGNLVNAAISTSPELGPAMATLMSWIKSELPQSINKVTHLSPKEWLQEFLRFLDHVNHLTRTTRDLQAAQSMNTTQKAWLVNQTNFYNTCITTLSSADVAKQLKSLTAHLSEIAFENDASVKNLVAIVGQLLPIFEEYVRLHDQVLRSACEWHAASNRMISQLSAHFIQLATNGFCTPSDKTSSGQESREAEAGTGLGDGEGAEDISKDIKDDEDLSELAQEAKSGERDESMEAEKDAVDMADEEFEGETGAEEHPNSDDEENEPGEQESDDDLDEEVGQVDGSEENAMDEKTFEGDKSDEQEKSAESLKGKKDNEVSAANDKEQNEEEPENGDDALEAPDTEADHEADQAQQEAEPLDPHADQEQNLELPDEIAMDGDQVDADAMSDIETDQDELDDKMSADDDGPMGPEEDADSTQGNDETAGEDTQEAVPMEEDADNEQEERQSPDPEDGNDQPDVAMLEDENQPEAKQPDALPSADSGQGNDKDDKTANMASSLNAHNDEETDPSTEAAAQSGEAEGNEVGTENRTQGQAGDKGDQKLLPFKQLGDVLKQWYNQNRDIAAAREEPVADPAQSFEQEEKDMDFEHLPDNAESDMQALGTASAEQSTSLDAANAIDMDTREDTDAAREQSPEPPMKRGDDFDEVDANFNPHLEASETHQASKAMVGKPTDVDMDAISQAGSDELDDDVDDVDNQLTKTHISEDEAHEPQTIEEARKMWTEHESRTRNMALVLTEHLRLILTPTQATKMRGDFRTGKRLNIKKIIPYIASSYKRDKIWMRRSVPSKRSYQIMLAIDDSESMTERESKILAFDTLALMAKSMSMLEVGELCIVGFGERVKVAHDFQVPFTSDAGAEVLRQFTFAQTKTDVRKLLRESIALFREARLKATGAAQNLWQLQMIISDGDCEDHASIRQLVRQAHEEQIMVVFIIVDSATKDAPDGSKKSILDLPRAEFVKDANGESQLKMSKYLDTFPFAYYLIVRDVLELPHVLAGALRQWFAEVVETGS